MKQKRWQLVYLSATHPTTEKIAILLFALVHVAELQNSTQLRKLRERRCNRTIQYIHVLITYLCVRVCCGVTSKAGVCATRNSRFHSISTLASSTVAQLAKLDCNQQVGGGGLGVRSPDETRRALMTY